MLQHFRSLHRNVPAIVNDFPVTPGKLGLKKKRDDAQASVVESIMNMKPMPPENRVALKITDCISDYCSLNNRTLDMVNDVGLVRIMAAANPRYQFFSRTYMTKTKLPLRYAAAVRSIRKVIDVQPGGWFTCDLWSTENSAQEFLGLNFYCLDEHFKYWCFSIGLQTFNDRKTAPAILREWIKCFIEWGFLEIIADAPFVLQIECLEVPNVNAYKGWHRIYGVIADHGPNVQATYLRKSLMSLLLTWHTVFSLLFMIALILRGQSLIPWQLVAILSSLLTNPSQLRIFFFSCSVTMVCEVHSLL